MTDFAIPIRLDSFLNYYPLVTKTPVTTKVGSKTIVNKTLVKLKDPGGSLDKELDGWATENFNQNASYTTCCIQMSHAINMVFHTADTTKMVGLRTIRRPTHAARIKSVANMEFRYVASVDEMKAFLDDTFGEGDEISSRTDIDDRPGIVVFMGHETYGVHTEVWTGDNFHQAFMRGNFVALTRPKVWFWSIGDPNLIDI
jgi:hypothetical protein